MQMNRMRRVRPDNQPESEEQCVIASNAYEKSNSRVGKLMRELQGNVTQKGLVLLLVEIAERPEASVDFDIPLASYLNMFLQCRGEVVMSEAGHLILSAARIYSRRVDQIYEAMEQMIVGMEKGIKATEESEKIVTPKPKRAMKRPKTDQDPLYEAEMAPKQLKIASLSKTTETLSSVKTFESPKNFFREWEKYKDWRIKHTKKMKCPVPYSVQQDNVSFHPSLWKLSSIEDFDYEDDTDTKRNYQVFTNYIEHRHNTLVNDINFIMHFKVKDFIEAEEDEIEIMSFLGLPPPPKRIWPPLCKRHHIQKNKEKDIDNISEVSEDYINNYVELENALLECDTVPSEKAAPELIEKYKSIAKGNNGQRIVAMEPENVFDNDNQIELNLIVEKHPSVQCTGENNDENIFENTNPCQDASVEQGVLQENTESIRITENLQTNVDTNSAKNAVENLSMSDVPLSCSADSGVSDLFQLSGASSELETNIQSTAGDHSLDISTVNNNILESTMEISAILPPEKLMEIESRQLSSNEIVSQVEIGQAALNEIKSVDFQENDFTDTSVDKIRNDEGLSNKIIIRLSIDEGVALSDLDEVDLAMLSPVVELVDILQPVMNEFISPKDLVIHEEERFKNFLGIDYNLLNHKQDFFLPHDVIFKEADLSINLFKIPEHKLRKNCLFKLPEEFQIYQRNRTKRKSEASPPARRTIKLFKLNDGSPQFITTPPQSPSREEDFYGFPNSPDVSEENRESQQQPSTSQNGSPTKIRSVSQDSGIENTEHTTDTSLNVSNLDQSQSLNNSSIVDSSNLGLPILQSTAIQNSSSLDITLNDTLNASAKDQESGNDACNQRKSDNELIEPIELNLEENAIEMRTKVQNWHRYLKPILRHSKERHHFDVYAIGSEIIDKFPNINDVTQPTITFDAIMQDKDPSYISRYFLSTLLLANQNNVRLQVVDSNKEEPTSLNKLQLTLQSRKRHTISIEDDIGATPAKRKSYPSSTSQEQHLSSSCSEVSSSSSEQEEEETEFIHSNEKEMLEILQRHRETNRDMLIKEIQKHRDDYIRILSKKYSLDLGLYFTPDEMQRLLMEKDRVSNSERSFEEECLIYPKKINIRQNINKSKNCDDADSGFHSHSTTELESAVVL